MKDLDYIDVMTYTQEDGEVNSSSTPMIMRMWRRNFGCSHKFVTTVTPTKYISGLSRTLKDYFCTKCWLILTKDEYKSFNRENKLKKLKIK